MKRPEDYTTDERTILNICEACRLAILSEEVRRYEEELKPLTNLQKEIIYQRYRDKATDLFSKMPWEEMYALFDALYLANEESHKDDWAVYA